MLRVTIRNNDGETRFVVEGKLVGDCVSELEKSWKTVLADASSPSILVDISSVSFIDVCGKQLLARMYESGIRFAASGLLPKCLVEEIATKLTEVEPSECNDFPGYGPDLD